MRTGLILASTLALGACSIATDAHGETVKRGYEVGAFDAVSLGGHHNVVVTVGPKASVRAEGDSEEIEKLEIRVENGDLHIGQKKRKGWNMSFGSHGKPVTVYVTTPSLKAAAIGGSGDMRIDKVQGAAFEASIGGSGDMDIASLKVESASFSVAGSGGIKAAGSASATDVSIAGSGDVDLSGVKSRAASVSIVGSGDVRAHAAESASVSIMGSGNVAISGGAKCKVSKMGSGDVSCG